MQVHVRVVESQTVGYYIMAHTDTHYGKCRAVHMGYVL